MTSIYMPFYFEWAEFLSNLSDAEYGRLVKAILAFAMGKECAPKLSREANMAYKMITASIARSEGHRLGIIPRKDEKKTAKEPKVFKRIENGTPTQSSIFDKNEEKSPTKCDKSEVLRAKTATTEIKAAPTREQVRNFFKNQGFRSNPDEFFNFYESNGWKVGQNPMENWHASAENWELRQNRERIPAKVVEEPKRYGDFDVNEAFQRALKRSYEEFEEDEEEGERREE